MSDAKSGSPQPHALDMSEVPQAPEFADQLDERGEIDAKDCKQGFTTELSGRFRCDDCGKTFVHRGMMRRHVLAHTRSAGGGEFQCLVCQQQFQYRSSLKRHEKLVHPNNLAVYAFVCDVDGCEKKFRYKSSLDHHKLVHEERRDFTCDLCGHAFREKHKLATHLLTHVPNCGTFRCARGCGQEFVQHSTWLKHHLESNCTPIRNAVAHDAPLANLFDTLLTPANTRENEIAPGTGNVANLQTLRTRLVGPNLITTTAL